MPWYFRSREQKFLGAKVPVTVWKISLHSAVNLDARHRQNVTTVLIVANNRNPWTFIIIITRCYVVYATGMC